MAAPRFRFLALLSREDGSSLGRFSIEPDWYPLVESAAFLATRRSRGLAHELSATIVPMWDQERGAPFVCGARATVEDGECCEVACDVPIAYFRNQVQNVASALIEAGGLKDGDIYRYRIAAFECPPEEPVTKSAPDWAIEEVPASPVCGERSLTQYLKASHALGDTTFEDCPVFIPTAILKQAEELKESARDKETGGILIGYIWRDTESPEVFTEITALIPAQHTVACPTRLTFTADTWDSVRAAISIRNRGETWLAWHHTHPSRYWCECPVEAQRECPLGRQFFSVTDLALHRTVFGRGFNTALVTGDRPLSEGGWEMVHVLYGWRSGMVEPRGFYMMNTEMLAKYSTVLTAE